MTEEKILPVVVVSKCLGFDACRYNGVMIPDSFIAALKTHVRFVPVCPEVEIGLGIPRTPIRIISEGGKRLLYQSATGKDYSDKMRVFTSEFLNSLIEVDGFILKFKSPSCGIGGVKIFPGIEAQTPVEKGMGFFGGEVVSRFEHLPVEDEGRLKNWRIRDHFLTKLYTVARFKRLSMNPSMRELIEFQARNKLLFMAYSQSVAKKLGAIVANHEHLEMNRILDLYQNGLSEVFSNPPKTGSIINMLEHAFGGVSQGLSADEKKFFKKCLEDYRAKRVPLSVPLKLIHSWALRFESGYLSGQTFIEPYPPALMDITDSGKGRDL
jgi:uncharacterized protein YbgA (DUF1722 family)/uncharacterized protein YbbK (DUF523 family)